MTSSFTAEEEVDLTKCHIYHIGGLDNFIPQALMQLRVQNDPEENPYFGNFKVYYNVVGVQPEVLHLLKVRFLQPTHTRDMTNDTIQGRYFYIMKTILGGYRILHGYGEIDSLAQQDAY